VSSQGLVTRWPLRAIAVDLALAACAVYAANVLTKEALDVAGAEHLGLAAHAVATAHGGAVAVRRVAVRGAYVALIVTGTVYAVALGLPVFMLGPAVLFVTYSLGLHLTRRQGLPFLALGALSLLVLLRVGPFFPGWDSFTLYAALIAAVWFLGTVVRRWQVLAQEHAERAAELEQARLELAGHAVAADRVRIARELHDVVAHSMSVVAMHAGSARLAVGTNLEAERVALEVIERSTRDALAEMRRLVTVLRHEDGSVASRQPAPGLSNLHELVATVAQAGVTVDVRTTGDLTQVPPGVSLAAYRVIQEALTNVVRHAGPTRAGVVAAVADDMLSVSVENDEPARRAGEDSAAGGGHGTIGMRERVELYGGTLTSDHTAAGGWRVEARMPCEKAR